MKKLFHAFVLVMLATTLNAQMELVYNTNNIDGTTILLPLSGTVNVTVDWGDGNIENFTTPVLKEHTYTDEGIYIVGITGQLTHFGSSNVTYSWYTDVLVEVISFGDLGLTSLSYAFYGGDSLISVPDFLPSSIIDLSHCFSHAFSLESVDNLELWDVGNVSDMTEMFYEANNFNQDIGAWDVSNVNVMSWMFAYAHNFNQDIGDWDVSNVTNMQGMFYYTYYLNQNIGDWDVSNVTNMGGMFHRANVFNQDIGAWDVSNVNVMGSMFWDANNFNQDISGWCVEQIPNEPTYFSKDCPLLEGYKPHWGVECFTSTYELFSKNIQIYPNPAKESLNIINHSNFIINNVFIYNLSGLKLISTEPINNAIDIDKLLTGIYIIEIVTNQSTIRRKLIIE